MFSLKILLAVAKRKVILQDDSDTLAASDASGTKSVLGASSVQSMSQMTGDSSTRSAKSK